MVCCWNVSYGTYGLFGEEMIFGKTLSKMGIILSILFVFGQSIVHANPPDRGIVMVYSDTPTGRTGGSGFVVEAPSGLHYTLTNAHVCALTNDGHTMDIYSEHQNRTYQKVRIRKVGINVDICALDAAPRVPATPLGNMPHPLQRVVIMGHPALQPVTISEGYIQHMVAGIAETTAKVLPGSSGSPMLDRYFNLIGIVFQYSPSDGDSYVISVAYIREFLKGL